jgi:leucyl aminopeptidase
MDHQHGAAAPSQLLTGKELAILEAEVRRRHVDRDIGRYAGLDSRHVVHPHNKIATRCLEKDLTAIGGGRLRVRQVPFKLRKPSGKRLANVEAVLPGVCSPHVIIISAHLDCTGDRDTSFVPRRGIAPGADDDASGMAGVLAAARAIMVLSRAQRPRQPRAEIRFLLFNAEEQGQRGSRVYAKRERKSDAPIIAVYHMDMIGYGSRKNGVIELHTGFARNLEVQAASLELAHHMAEVCAHARYPLIPQVYFHRRKNRDPGQGFSDHTSFHRQGYPAVMISEDFFPGQGALPAPGNPNPFYHTPNDLPGHVDVHYTTTIARAVAAAAWHRATRIACCPVRNAPAQHQHGGGGAADGDDGHHETDEE